MNADAPIVIVGTGLSGYSLEMQKIKNYYSVEHASEQNFLVSMLENIIFSAM